MVAVKKEKLVPVTRRPSCVDAAAAANTAAASKRTSAANIPAAPSSPRGNRAARPSFTLDAAPAVAVAVVERPSSGGGFGGGSDGYKSEDTFFSSRVLVDAYTFQDARSAKVLNFLEFDPIMVKGKKRPVTSYAPAIVSPSGGARDGADRFLLPEDENRQAAATNSEAAVLAADAAAV
ncbi:unnamed protein product, partial [Phaeothamnion confervicola]